MDVISDIGVDRLAAAKGFDADWLCREFGLYDQPYFGQPAVRIPVRAADGRVLYEKVRLSDGTCRRDPEGGPFELYAQERLAQYEANRIVLAVEGESDTWAAVLHRCQVVGIPSAGGWRSGFAVRLAGLRIVLWEEPDQAARKLVCAVAADLPQAWLVAGDAQVKDLCALHQLHPKDFRRAFAERLSRAVRITQRAAAISESETNSPPVQRRAWSRPRVGTQPLSTLADRARDVAIEAACEKLGIVLRGNRTKRAARCQLHEDGKESMSVDLKKGVWYCHACQIGGDTIRLVERVRGVSFREAVEYLTQ